MKNNWTGERLETFVYNRDSTEHLHRYAIASDYIDDKVVLDIASGEGYGSNILSRKAKYVYGVDIDNTTVQLAKLKYKKNNLEFLVGTASGIPLEDDSIDVVVSFETIEHHDEHDKMMIEIKRVLKPEGLLIISTPDKLYYTDERNYNNEYHIKELYKQEFKDLISKYFKRIQLLSQKYVSGTSIIQEDNTANELRFFSGDYADISDVGINPLYLVALASDCFFNDQKITVFDGSLINNEIFNREKEKETDKIYNSNTYKVGHLILLPFKFLKMFFYKGSRR